MSQLELVLLVGGGAIAIGVLLLFLAIGSVVGTGRSIELRSMRQNDPEYAVLIEDQRSGRLERIGRNC